MDGVMDNPFERFGIAPIFDIDEPHLAETFRRLQRVVHPDRHAGGSEQERQRSVEQAAAVNEAFRTLRDPVRRARCLLALRGVDTQEGVRTFRDPVFLMDQMELRARLEEAREAPDPLGLLSEVKEVLQKRRVALIGEVSGFLRQDTPESLGQAAERVRRLGFFERIAEEANLLEERLTDCLPRGGMD